MTEFPFRKAKSVGCVILILVSALFALSFLPYAKAVTVIISVDPTSGNVGSTVNVRANITSVNGSYALYFDETSLPGGVAVGNDVNASFTIVDSAAGSHNVTIIDVATGENATSVFTVVPSFYLDVGGPTLPLQLQEGDSVPINVTVKGGDPTITYVANITVQTPSNASHAGLPGINVSSVGNGNATINYAGSFQTGASTNLTGKYSVLFNTTLATKSFTVGLTNSTEYHRNDTLDVRTAGYAPEENLTLTITGNNLNYSVNLTAEATGTIHYTNQGVLSNASIGVYTLNVTSLSNVTKKELPDTQTFSIPGFSVNITAKNLAGEPVSNVLLKTFQDNNTAASGTADSNGTVYFTLELGTYFCNASLAIMSDQRIGEKWIEVANASSFDLVCNLTNLRILVVGVKDEAEVRIPDVGIQLVSQPLNQSVATDINGTVVFHSMLPNFSYSFNASRYGSLFNTTTFPSLLDNAVPKDWFDVKIICPVFTLKVFVNNPNANGQPINNASVTVQEVIGGLYYGNSTIDGVATFNCILGNYSVRVYDSIGRKLNETTVILNTTIVEATISCKLYDLNISVRISDYFDQPIRDTNVTLQRDELRASGVTGADGTITFTNIVGGSFTVTVRLPGQSEPCVATMVFADNSTTIPVKIEKYVLLVGMLVETSQLLTVMVIVITAIFILGLEILRRRRLRQPKSKIDLK